MKATSDSLNLNLKIWRQKNNKQKGEFKEYKVSDISRHISFLEMLDILNEDLESKGLEPVCFDHDCREGICGSCGMMINGKPHGGMKNTTVCQLHMRFFNDGDTIIIEPWRARAFPILRDLVVDRTSFDRIMQAGGYISSRTGSAPEANSIAIRKENAEDAFEAAACIGCGACVASCKNASASLFTSAKISHLSLLPQGAIEAKERAYALVTAMEQERFGGCSNESECEVACPKSISIENIARMNREYMKSLF